MPFLFGCCLATGTIRDVRLSIVVPLCVLCGAEQATPFSWVSGLILLSYFRITF